MSLASKSRVFSIALDILVVAMSLAALYLWLVIYPPVLDNTIVYKGF
jgi:hypothetical protein